MLVKILGLVDVAALIFLTFHRFIPAHAVLYVAGILAAKGLIFTFAGNKISILDIIVGFYIAFVSYGFSNLFLTGAAIIYLGQKAALSFIARG